MSKSALMLLRSPKELLLVLAFCLCICGVCAAAPAIDWTTLSRPETSGLWVRPARDGNAQPVWGHARGLRAGLHPMSGPRGLLRIYTPYMGQPDSVLINFIAIEPIVQGESVRGFSELERSRLDDVQGKRFWAADSPEDETPRLPQQFPARGVLGQEGTTKTLTVYVPIEPFDNGAKVYVRLRFRADRPYEVGVAAFARKDSKPLKHCILTATMGNFARLRHLHLQAGVKSARELWPDFKGDGFAPHAVFPLSAMFRNKKGHALFVAAPDEENPAQAEYAPETEFWWKYTGKPATQYWRCETPDPNMAGQVNGRACYWGGQSPIPGGVAFENFELIEPFSNGAEYWFGVTPQSPEAFIRSETQ